VEGGKIKEGRVVVETEDDEEKGRGRRLRKQACKH
jgi:hypothetical protein